MIGKLYKISWHILVNQIAASVIVPSSIRSRIYKLGGIRINTHLIKPGTFIMWKDVVIGRGTFINRGCFLDVMTEIGENCNIGYQVMFCTSTHHVGDSSRRAGEGYGKPIIVENGCWIGARAILLPGVTIGEGCIIAAGALVNRNCQPNGLYAGVPARRIKDL